MKWTPEKLELLRVLYPCTPNAVLGERLGASPRNVGQRARKLGLKKCEAFMRSELSGKLQAGAEPWNKGTNYVAGGRSAETRFKKGEMKGAAQANYVPIGSLRVTKDGYLERKVTDAHPVPARRWVAVHRLVWEQSHGPVAPGHVVVFKPGQLTTDPEAITVEKLEMVSRRELMRRNSRHTRYPPELNQLIQLRGALRRKINNRSRDEEPHAGRA